MRQPTSLLTPTRNRLATLARGAKRRLRGYLPPPRSTQPTGPGVYFVTEGADWVIDDIGAAITRYVGDRRPDLATLIGRDVAGCRGKVVHFGSFWVFINQFNELRGDNRAVVTVFHGQPEDGPAFARGFEMLRDGQGKLDRIIVSCSPMERRLRDYGIAAEKITRIPIGIELADFRPADAARRQEMRERLGVPPGATCIGSFQKDGNGWGEGDEPKLVKGPDIFADAVEALAADHDIFVLLTGPARGYVKRRLEAAGIAYRHDMLDDPREVADYYACLDLYLMTSREEGGPKSVLESLATATPLLATRTGMAVDLLRDGANARLLDIEDTPAIIAAARWMIDNPAQLAEMTTAGLETVRAYDWSVIAQRHFDEVYAPSLAKLPG